MNHAIKHIENTYEENPSLCLLYSNHSAAYIRDKNYYSGYEDAKHSLKLKKQENLKGFYRAAICAYHLVAEPGFPSRGSSAPYSLPKVSIVLQNCFRKFLKSI